MKILFLLRFFPVYGGGETVTIKLANKLVEHGYDVGIFLFGIKHEKTHHLLIRE